MPSACRGRPGRWRASERARPGSAVRVLVAAVLLVVLAGCSGSSPEYSGAPTSALQACPISRLLVPQCGVLWGIHVQGSAGSLTASVAGVEHDVHRTFDVVHVYHDMSMTEGNQFPTPQERSLQRGSRLLYVSWEARRYDNDKLFPWRDIADGRLDASVIDPTAENIRANGQRMFVSFAPEPDRFVGQQGSIDDYVAAYRHVHDRFAALGVHNVVWVWVTTGYLPALETIADLYPGDHYVDWIGWDPYNFASCRNHGWRSFAETVVPFYQWLMGTGLGHKPFMLPEYGTVDDPRDPSAVNDWYRSVPDVLRAHPQVKAVMLFDADVLCDTTIAKRKSTVTAFTAAGLNPYVTGRSAVTASRR